MPRWKTYGLRYIVTFGCITRSLRIAPFPLRALRVQPFDVLWASISIFAVSRLDETLHYAIANAMHNSKILYFRESGGNRGDCETEENIGGLVGLFTYESKVSGSGGI